MPFEKGHATNLGRKASEETRAKLREIHKGSKPYLWGAGFTRGNHPWNKHGSVSRNAYFAGLLDGEGSVFFTPNGKRKGKEYKKLCVAFGMRSDKSPCLEEGQKIWGGTIHIKPIRKNNQHEARDWKMWTAIAERFLKSVRPYLRVKNKQVEIALKYRDLQNKIKHNPYGVGITEGQIEYRKKLEEELKKLNH